MGDLYRTDTLESFKAHVDGGSAEQRAYIRDHGPHVPLLESKRTKKGKI